MLNELFLLNKEVLPIHDCFMVHTGNYYYLLNMYAEQLRLIFLEEYDIVENFLGDLVKF